MRPFLLRPFALGLAALAAVTFAACDSDQTPDDELVNPDGVNFDNVSALEYDTYVQGILTYRDVLADSATTVVGDAADYEWEDVLAANAGEHGGHGARLLHDTAPRIAGTFVLPFDAEESLLVKLLEDLPAEAELPYPNLRRLEADEIRYLKRWMEAGARNDDGDVAYADATHLLYACEQEQNRVAIIDQERMLVIRHVYFADLGFADLPRGPHHVAFEPDGGAWYVSLIDGNTVLKLSDDLSMDPSSGSYLLGQMEPDGAGSDFTTPGLVVVDPTSDRLFVGRSTGSASGTTGVAVVDRSTMTFDEIAVPFGIPHGIVLTPDSRFLLVASLETNQVAAVDAATGDLVSLLDLGGPRRSLVHFGVTPDGATATLTSEFTREVLFFSVSPTGQLALNGSAETGEGPWHAHLDHDGRDLFVPNRRDNTLSIIDVATRTVRMTLSNPQHAVPLAQPHTPVPGHDGGTIWVSNSNFDGTYAPLFPFLGEDGAREPLPNNAYGTVTVFDLATGDIVRVIELGRYPSGLEHQSLGGHDH